MDIYATEFDNYEVSESPVNNVPLIITGVKRIGEDPIIYKYNKDCLSDGSGNVSLTNIEWDSYNIDLPEEYADYDIIMSSPSIPIDLLPNTLEEITLYLE